MARQGLYDPKLKCPTVLGFEASGDVVEIGAGVQSHKVNARNCNVKKWFLSFVFILWCFGLGG